MKIRVYFLVMTCFQDLIKSLRQWVCFMVHVANPRQRSNLFRAPEFLPTVSQLPIVVYIKPFLSCLSMLFIQLAIIIQRSKISTPPLRPKTDAKPATK